MTSHRPSSTRLNAQRIAEQRTANALSLLDARARSRRRWAFALALGLNALVWKTLASLPQAPRQAASPGAIEWSRVVLDPLPSNGETSRLAPPASAPKSVAISAAQRDFAVIAPRVPRTSQTRIARRDLSAPKTAPQPTKSPQRDLSVERETQPMRHNPDLEPPPPQQNRRERNPADAPDVRSTTSQRATWTTPSSSSASSTKASEYDRLPFAEQTPPPMGSATEPAKTSRESGASSTRSGSMTAAPSSGDSSSADSGQRSGADLPAGFQDGSSRDGTSSSASGGNRGGAKSEGGFGGRSNGRMSAPDAPMRELPDLPRSEPRPTPRPEPRATPEESRPVATPRTQPQETPRRVEERPQPTPATRDVEKPKRAIEVREAQADRIVKPRVPKRLRREKRRLSVGLDVDVDESGRATPRLRESSGDNEMDEEALKAARKTRWKPRAEDGKATRSTQRMRYDVDVQDGNGNDGGDEESAEE